MEKNHLKLEKSPSEIDYIRQSGFRPQIVGCIISKPLKKDITKPAEIAFLQNKILFVYKEKYKLWQLPQGGIDNNETITQATLREMTEELGKNFTKSFQIDRIIGEDRLIFPKQLQGSRKLQTDTGEKIFMIGKKYFFVVISVSNTNLNINETEFDDYQWLNYKEALKLVNKIHQKGKRQIILKGLKLLRQQNLL